MRTEQPIAAAKRPDAKQHSKFPSGRVLSKQQYECFLGIQREISMHQCPVLSVCRNQHLYALHGHDMMGNVLEVD